MIAPSILFKIISHVMYLTYVISNKSVLTSIRNRKLNSAGMIYIPADFFDLIGLSPLKAVFISFKIRKHS
jgi:hypothetical protein